MTSREGFAQAIPLDDGVTAITSAGRAEHASEKASGLSDADTVEENGTESLSVLSTSSSDVSDETHACMLTAMRMLAYGDQSEKRLREKLRRHGYSDEATEAAIHYCLSKGYLNDSRFLCHAAEVLARDRLYGKRRIFVELYKKGYNREQIAELDFESLDVDFIRNCAALLCRQNHLFDEESARAFEPDDRAIARAVRYGYSVSEVRAAAALLRGEA